MISQKQINGEPFVVVETPRWKAEIILSVGSNMLSLIDRNTGFNILREPPSMEALKKQPEIYGLPVLIPPNCIYQGKFSWRGRDYSLPVNNRFGNHIHGVVLHAPWEFLDSSEEEGRTVVRTRCIYDERNPMFAGFPHKMDVVLTYTFLPDRVLQKLSATNLSDSVMPFAAGFHASFRFPLGDRSPEAYRTSSVRVTVADYCWEFDKAVRGTPTGKKLPWNGFDTFRTGKIINRAPGSACGGYARRQAFPRRGSGVPGCGRPCRLRIRPEVQPDRSLELVRRRGFLLRRADELDRGFSAPPAARIGNGHLRAGTW